MVVQTRSVVVITALGLLAVLPAAATSAETIVSDFASSFDGWDWQWHKNSPTGTAGVVTLSNAHGYLDGSSLKFDMGDGHGDDGTLWIERQLAVSPTAPTGIDLSFELFNDAKSDLNNFEVKTAISTQNPSVQADFTRLGETNTAQGWVPFSVSKTLAAPSGQAWVALGIRVAWETHRDYWIDHVVVSTTAVPEPKSGALVLFCILTGALAARRQYSGPASASTFALGPYPLAPCNILGEPGDEPLMAIVTLGTLGPGLVPFKRTLLAVLGFRVAFIEQRCQFGEDWHDAAFVALVAGRLGASHGEPLVLPVDVAPSQLARLAKRA